MKDEVKKRWDRLMSHFCVSLQSSKEVFDELCNLYEQRAYHNIWHIMSCIGELECCFDSVLPERRNEIELAIWFHDAICDPKRNDNEEESARLARLCLKKLGHSHLSDKVSELILLGTKHFEGSAPIAFSSQEEVDVIHDVDLSILGMSKNIFDQYEEGIRQEYAFVPENVFREKRAEILQRFLDGPRIFLIDFFHGKYEDQARKNLARSIVRLSAR